MYFALAFYPQLSAELAAGIDAIARDHNPIRNLIKPHVTIAFPPTDQLEERPLVEHIVRVLSHWRPFPIRLGGFMKSPDHWLFLTLAKGAAEINRLREELYTGDLAEHGRRGHAPIPHVSLGLFIKVGCVYDWRNPHESDFDRERYEAALVLAKALPPFPEMLVERLHLETIPRELTEWTTGKRAIIPDDIAIRTAREFRLGCTSRQRLSD